ncbi:MAG: tRNA pseudouridine(55) synthase TruB [Patescibacteria group bacterium]
MPGIALINKPSGMTSHDVVNIVRHKTGLKKVGHCGTLDPLATGLLIILVGRDATRKQAQFLKSDKEYICNAVLGQTTDTYDIEGQVITKTDWKSYQNITSEELKKTLNDFIGKTNQTVPAYSAVRSSGKKLYEKAREGTLDLSELPSRQIEIFCLNLLSFNRDNTRQIIEFSFVCHCSSGTYIRSLVHDIGQRLGCGATLTSLKRTKIGPFSVDQAQDLIKGKELTFIST